MHTRSVPVDNIRELLLLLWKLQDEWMMLHCDHGHLQYRNRDALSNELRCVYRKINLKV